jgi:hypothetical protein
MTTKRSPSSLKTPFSGDALEAAGGDAQELVAHGIAVHAVDVLHPVDVEGDQRHPLAADAGLLDQPAERDGERVAAGKVGQGIEHPVPAGGRRLAKERHHRRRRQRPADGGVDRPELEVAAAPVPPLVRASDGTGRRRPSGRADAVADRREREGHEGNERQHGACREAHDPAAMALTVPKPTRSRCWPVACSQPRHRPCRGSTCRSSSIINATSCPAPPAAVRHRAFYAMPARCRVSSWSFAACRHGVVIPPDICCAINQ